MLDLLIVLAFVAYAVTVGLLSRRKASQGLGEYFLAGRTLKGWQAGASMAATQFAADTPLLVTGLIATGGVFLLWRLWIYGLAFLLMGFLFASHWQRAGVLTDAELTEIRYSGPGVLALRALKAIFYGVVINSAVLAMVLIAAVRIAEVFLPWHAWLPAGVYDPLASLVEWTGLAIASGATGLEPLIATTNNLISIHVIVLFTVLYSTTGGLRSVVATDVVQLVIALVGTFLYAAAVLHEAGGAAGLTTQLTELYGPADASRMLSFAPPLDAAIGAFVTVVALQWLFQMNADGTGYLAQRSMACRTERDARVAALVFAWVQIVVRSLPWIIIGLGLLVIVPMGASPDAAARETLFATAIDDLLPVGARGLMLTGLLAALASTLDTHMNWGASYMSNDLYKRILCKSLLKREASRRELVVAARVSTIIVLAIAFTVMVNLDSIQEAWKLTLLFGAGTGSVLVMRWLWERINLWSELAAMAAALLAAPLLLLFVPDDSEWLRIALMALVSTSAAVAAALIGPRTDETTLRAFYARVRPAGFWRATADLQGEDRNDPVRRLGRELLVTGVAAMSLFLALYGVSRFVIPLPGQSALWPIAALVGSALLAPLWWREAVGREGL